MKKAFNVKVTMEERWVDSFCSMLEKMAENGHIGHSSLIGFYADGDGDFRPEFKIDTDYNTVDGITDNTDKRPEVIFDAG